MPRGKSTRLALTPSDFTPEDCGGIEAYKDMLYCLKHPGTDFGREWRKWLGPDYDPENCDLAALNQALKRLAK